jgi:hypothetical protein
MILVDFHVHLYRCFSLPGLFAAADDNFRRAAGKQKQSQFIGVLCLAESSGYDVFSQLGAGLEIGEGWRCETTDEKQRLCLRSDGRELHLIAGRQINTEERIEVLALGTTETVPDDLPLHTTLEQVKALGTLPVLPWGVGKWLGSRGKLINEVLSGRDGIFPGDNRGRPYGWPDPGAFLVAAGQQNGVLPGSDPLPIAGEECRAGSYGAVIDEYIAGDGLWGQLAAAVCATSSVKTFGRRVSPFAFLVQQLQLRYSKTKC